MRLNLGYLLKSFLLYLNFKIQLGVRSVLWNPQSRIVIAMFRKKSFQNCYICFDEQTKTRERNRMNLRACKKNERKMEKNSMQLHTFLSFSFFLQPFYVDLCKNKSQQKKGVVQARQAWQNDPKLRIQFGNCTMKFCKGSFTNYVKKILEFFDHLPPCVDNFYDINVDNINTYIIL